jgi:hypothetical protein
VRTQPRIGRSLERDPRRRRGLATVRGRSPRRWRSPGAADRPLCSGRAGIRTGGLPPRAGLRAGPTRCLRSGGRTARREQRDMADDLPVPVGGPRGRLSPAAVRTGGRSLPAALPPGSARSSGLGRRAGGAHDTPDAGLGAPGQPHGLRRVLCRACRAAPCATADIRREDGRRSRRPGAHSRSSPKRLRTAMPGNADLVSC